LRRKYKGILIASLIDGRPAKFRTAGHKRGGSHQPNAPLTQVLKILSKEIQMANSAQPIKESIHRAQNLAESKIHDAAADFKDSSSGMIDNLNTKSRQFLQDAQGRASEIYDVSSNWVQENRVVTMIGVAAVAGLLGFFIGRRGENIDRIEI
jgi:ElaB/YqjD/DUF883 family membrane-anchored ribosome-binding protein